LAQANRMSGKPSRRLNDMAIIAPLVGFVLLAPPIIGLFATEGTLFGAPVILIYLFVIWFGLILAAGILSRKLSHSENRNAE